METNEWTSGPITWYDTTVFNRYVKNNYSLVPISLAYKFRLTPKINLLAIAGSYLGFLSSSLVQGSERTRQRENTLLIQDSGYAFLYSDKKYTNGVDVGIRFGCGVSYAVSKKFSARLELTVWRGLRKIDARHSNDSIHVPLSSPIQYDYFGLSSLATNFSYNGKVGIVYNL